MALLESTKSDIVNISVPEDLENCLTAVLNRWSMKWETCSSGELHKVEKVEREIYVILYEFYDYSFQFTVHCDLIPTMLFGDVNTTFVESVWRLARQETETGARESGIIFFKLAS